MLESKGRLELAQLPLGHTDIPTTSNIYIHQSDDQKHVAKDALDRAFSTFFEGANKASEDNRIAGFATNLLPNQKDSQ